MKKTDKMTAREAVLLEGIATILEFRAGDPDTRTLHLKNCMNALNELDETLVYMNPQTRKYWGQECNRLLFLKEARRLKNELTEMIEKNRINDEEEKICAEMF